MAETILIVDDEESIRRTFREWLHGANLGCEIVTAEDAERALEIANERLIDLAILDWNLGAGINGLDLLRDLYEFNRDLVAIMVTAYANLATPLDAMRMGVRDYLDKNKELDRDHFLTAVRRQLDALRPGKRDRQLFLILRQFQESVQKVLPLVRTATAMNDPVPFTESIRNLFRFLLRTTGATDGVLLVRSYDADRKPPEVCRAYDVQGQPLSVELTPFPRSVAGMVLSMQDPCVTTRLDQPGAMHGIQLQPFEQNRRCVLAAPLPVTPNLNVVLELFDKRSDGSGAFTEDDRRLVGAAAEFGAEMIRQALAEREANTMLQDAVAAALRASQDVAQRLQVSGEPEVPSADRPPPAPVMKQLHESLEQSSLGVVNADQALKLAELLRVIAVRHGPEATQYCIQLLEGVERLLRAATGLSDLGDREGPRP